MLKYLNVGDIMKLNDKRLIETQRLRTLIDYEFQTGFITDLDIINLSRVDYNYGNKKGLNEKEKLLKLIYNCPFLLCDLKNKNENIKAILPSFLEYRYKEEIKELKNQYKLGYINSYDFNKIKSELKFIYFESSLEGKEILDKLKSKKVKINVYKYK